MDSKPDAVKDDFVGEVFSGPGAVAMWESLSRFAKRPESDPETGKMLSNDIWTQHDFAENWKRFDKLPSGRKRTRSTVSEYLQSFVPLRGASGTVTADAKPEYVRNNIIDHPLKMAIEVLNIKHEGFTAALETDRVRNVFSKNPSIYKKCARLIVDLVYSVVIIPLFNHDRKSLALVGNEARLSNQMAAYFIDELRWRFAVKEIYSVEVNFDQLRRKSAEIERRPTHFFQSLRKQSQRFRKMSNSLTSTRSSKRMSSAPRVIEQGIEMSMTQLSESEPDLTSDIIEAGQSEISRDDGNILILVDMITANQLNEFSQKKKKIL